MRIGSGANLKPQRSPGNSRRERREKRGNEPETGDEGFDDGGDRMGMEYFGVNLSRRGAEKAEKGGESNRGTGMRASVTAETEWGWNILERTFLAEAQRTQRKTVNRTGERG
jgi:hypothetical protein